MTQKTPAMTNDDIIYFEKARAICCQQWGVPPWEFDQAWADGRITTANLQRSVDVALIMCPHPNIMEEWLAPGTMEARKKAREEAELTRSWVALAAMKEKERNGR